MCPDPHAFGRMRGSALMIALFVIVVMALLAAAMGRFLVDSGEKNTVEVRSVRALLAARAGWKWRSIDYSPPVHLLNRRHQRCAK